MEEIVKILPRYKVSITTQIDTPIKEKDVTSKEPSKRRKKTHEEYVEELKIKNPNVVPIEEYINSSTKIKHKCLIHDIVWTITPGNALQGKGCNQCMREKNRNKHKLSHNDYVKKVKSVNPSIEVLEQYIDYDTPILHKYLKCEHQSKVYPASIIRGCGCRICADKESGISKKKSHYTYIEELNIKNPNIFPLEEYISANIPILHKYKKCGHQAKITPSSALHGYGCRICSNKKVGERCKNLMRIMLMKLK